MKKLLLLSLLLTTTAYASTRITLLEDYVNNYETTNTKFYVDTSSGSVFADLSIGRYYRYPGYCIPDGYGHEICVPDDGRFEERKSSRIKISGLNLTGDNLMYNSVKGDVYCGRIKRKRRSIKIILSGKCKLESRKSNGKVTFSLLVR